MSRVELAAVLASIVLLASLVSVELGVTVALLELTLGVVAGNALQLPSQDWLDFVAKFASIFLTFLAGMEVDPTYVRRRLGASLGIGLLSFVGPFGVASLVAYFGSVGGPGLADHGHGPIDHIAGGCLRRARRTWADRRRRRKAPDERHLRDGSLHGAHPGSSAATATA